VKTYTPVFDPQLKIGFDATGKVAISWTSGTLVSAPTVNGTYAPVAGATSPYTVAPTVPTFYRILQ
jgi:hypothetical protein